MSTSADIQAALTASPRSAPRLIADTLGMYRRYPLLFLVLAAGVIVPYQLILVALAGSFDRSDLGGSTEAILGLLEFGVVIPLVSALHIHAVAAVRAGTRPRLGSVARRGVVVLPVVAAVTVASMLGITLGFVAFVAPGIYLMLRWIVVAQAAAVECAGWISAFRSSYALTEGRYGHVILFTVLVGLIAWLPVFVLEIGFEGAADVVSFFAALVGGIFFLSFTALATALLYFDLWDRFELSPGRVRAAELRREDRRAESTGSSWDPRAYSDQERPKGWYVDPASPARMRYWGAGGEGGWQGTTSTPRKVRRAWRKEAEPGS